MKTYSIQGETLTVAQIAERLNVVKATAANRLSLLDPPLTWDKLRVAASNTSCTVRPWTTAEERTARAAYLVGGSELAVKMLPHRTRQAVQSRAREKRWKRWTRIEPGTQASIAVALALEGPTTSYDLSVLIDRETTHASAVLANLHRRGVLDREARTLTESWSSNAVSHQIQYAYSASAQYREAMDALRAVGYQP
ncbi:hypothetical protein [Xanthomonas phage XPV2]|nr:hypothetical protein [Xanthomonas phage XPV2]